MLYIVHARVDRRRVLNFNTFQPAGTIGPVRITVGDKSALPRLISRDHDVILTTNSKQYVFTIEIQQNVYTHFMFLSNHFTNAEIPIIVYCICLRCQMTEKKNIWHRKSIIF